MYSKLTISYITWMVVTGSDGQSVNNMAAGVYRVEVEAALQCNPAIKATKTFNISVPDNVKVGAVQGKYTHHFIGVMFINIHSVYINKHVHNYYHI